MTIAPLPRRLLLQSGAALAGPLALAGIWPQSIRAAPGAAGVEDAPLSGMLAGWLVIEPDHGAAVRLVQLDEASRPVRQIAAADVALAEVGTPLQQLCQRAHAVALEAVARSWSVPAAECAVSRGRIAHEGRGQAIGYTLWVDVA